MEQALAQLRAAAEPTRLRLLALCATAQLCVSDLVAVLGQSQPRLSRHLRLLTEAGLLERAPEGANIYFRVPASGAGGALVRAADAALYESKRRGRNAYTEAADAPGEPGPGGGS